MNQVNTHLTIDGQKFRINGNLTYEEINGNDPKVHGLIMNARFIQGIFDDQENRAGFNRYGKKFDPMINTKELVSQLSHWYEYGLRGLTVGLQGGGPCFTRENTEIKNNPYAEDGKSIDADYLERLSLILAEADKLGMVVIVSLLYADQTRWIKDDITLIQCVKTACNWLRDSGYKNIIVEVANEQDIEGFTVHPIINDPTEVVKIIDLAKRESGFPVGCSMQGGKFSEDIALASDIVFVHGNDCHRQEFSNLLRLARETCPTKPILCNEDSQALTQMEVSFEAGVSWGYYNNMTKQEPPVYWEITKGEDLFFATRLAMYLGITCPTISEDEKFYLQGLEKHMTDKDMRWIRLASLHPEKIDYVKFYRNNELMDIAYDDPFLIGYEGNWRQTSVINITDPAHWKAEIHLRDGSIVIKETSIQD